MDKKTIHIENFPPFLAKHKARIEELCLKHYVLQLYAIGSVLTPNFFRSDSDVDFVFEFDEVAISDKQYNPNLWAFWRALETLLGRKVDLIHGPSLKNPYLIEEINKTKQLIYDQKVEEVSMGHRS